ncbi:hypothetical protein [Brevibacillus sp. SIMBA_040]|uniref:hypothetical protein n=1 Tax=unclassified Brevibacillus TaxID=2684853 RepID=UPI00397C6B77
MKKKIAMSVMALAVSAMAGSAFAAEKAPAAKMEGPAQVKMATLTAVPAINLEQMAKEKGITVEELIAQLEKEGKITKGVALVDAKIDPANGDSNLPMTAIFHINDAEQGIVSFSLTKAISLEEMAKEKGITVEELIAQLEKEGKISKAVPTTPAAKK